MSEYIIDWDENLVIDTFSKNSLREEIVRCRDCYYADEFDGGYWCDRFGVGKEHVSPSGFCAWGERLGK